MGRLCTVCTHPDREAIDKALVGHSTSIRGIGRQYGLKLDALRRHKAHHLAAAIKHGKELADAAQAGVVARVGARVAEQAELEDVRSLDLFQQLRKLFGIVDKLFDACDRFLLDPNNPERYDLNPRSHELEVTYLEVVGERKDGTQIVVPKKDLLSELLPRFEEKADTTVLGVRWKVTDPRRLVLEAAHRLEGQQRWLAELVDKAKTERGADLLRSPEWRALRARIVEVVGKCESCRTRIVAALGAEPG